MAKSATKAGAKAGATAGATARASGKVPGRVLGKVPGASRRQQYSASTKRALTEVAGDLFAAQGYAGTSLDAIVAGARVTKGALYHHFSGKQGLFEAVFERVETETTEQIQRSLREASDPWEKAISGLRAFLDAVRQPAYRRIVMQEGPAILGYERFREQEERSSYGVVQDIVRSVLSASSYQLEEGMIETFSRIFFGAMSAAGESVASAEDPQMASARVEAAIGFILTGMRTLGDAGVELPHPEMYEPTQVLDVSAETDAAPEPEGTGGTDHGEAEAGTGERADPEDPEDAEDAVAGSEDAHAAEPGASDSGDPVAPEGRER